MSTASVSNNTFWKYYRLSTYGALLVYALVAVYCVVSGKLYGLYIVPLLAFLEIALSFDNALVNAVYLKRLDHTWQRRFLTWGIYIAVVGMRFAFPILIVCATARMNPVDVITLAFTSTDYAKLLLAAHIQIVVFGGVYLFQLGPVFLADASEKEARWLAPIEVPLEWLGKKCHGVGIMSFVLGVAATLLLAFFKWPEERTMVIVYGAASIGLFQFVRWIGSKFSDEEDENDEQPKVDIVKLSGKAAASVFAYLELQDAMFSFDGVMGAFAFTTLIVLIMAGLGIGALFVRSMTIQLVELDVLGNYRYLGNGAFTAILFLPFAMWFDLPEYVTGGVTFLLIAGAYFHSRHENNQDKIRAISATGDIIA